MQSRPTKAAAVVLLLLGAAMAGRATVARAVCEGQPGAPVVVRPARDTRLMQSHSSANDGAAGLIWLKATSNVRGLVGFDLTCQAAATPALDCAGLEVSIYDGTPTLEGSTFSAQRMLVPWAEGNRSFNEFGYGGEKLGPFDGSGTGPTWDCRIDPDISDDASNCSSTRRWRGGDDCGGGVPCYDPTPSTAFYADPEQSTLAWDVTDDVVGADGVTGWLLKVLDETSKSGSVKFYTRDGARFMAENEPGPGGAARFDAAPRLLLWGSGVQAPSATLIAPLGPVTANAAEVRIEQHGATVGGRARWANLTTGAWGWMTADGLSQWTATVPLLAGENEMEFTFFDGCGTEGRLREVLVQDGASICTGSGCARSFLCYSARITTRASAFEPVSRLELDDGLAAPTVDVREPVGLCVPADIEGDGLTDPLVFGVTYVARASAGTTPPPRRTGIGLTDRFGPLSAETLRVDRVIAPAALGLGFDPRPPSGVPGPYACYRLGSSTETTVSKNFPVEVVDQFEDRTYRIRRPSRVCYPTGAGSVGPLVCYRVIRAPVEPRHQKLKGLVHTSDLFGSLELDTRSEQELCVEARAD